MNNAKILITGGAGFVGSNLTLQILNQYNPEEIIIVDNLLSSESSNVVEDPRVSFVLGSIADDRILQQIPKDLNYVFHLFVILFVKICLVCIYLFITILCWTYLLLAYYNVLFYTIIMIFFLT